MSNQQMTQKVSEYLRDYDDSYETGYNDAKLDNLLLVRPEDKSPSWWAGYIAGANAYLRKTRNG